MKELAIDSTYLEGKLKVRPSVTSKIEALLIE